MKYGFIIDNRKCIGCHACTVACKSEHDVPIGVNRTWVKQTEKGTFPDSRRIFSVLRCNHCTDAPCVEICPVEALFVRVDGIVDFDNNRCIGCKSCMQACPYDALYIDPETQTAAKCNYCAHRVDVGLEPACVNVCPEHAIISGDMDNPDTEISQLLSREQVTARKVEKGTKPNLFYIDGDLASLTPSTTERSKEYLWNSQSKGVGHFAKFADSLMEGKDTEQMAKELAEGPNHTEVSYVGNEKNEDKVTSVEALMRNANPKRVYDTPDKGILWGWEVSSYVWTKAISAGAILVPFLAVILGLADVSQNTLLIGGILGIVFLTLTGALLVKDLDQPMRFTYVLLRPQWKSWLVKGGYAITIFGGLVSLLIASIYFDLGAIITNIALWGSAIFGVIVAIYTAFLFAQAKGRDFWQSPTMAIHMLIHSFMAGAAVFMLGANFIDASAGWVSYLTYMLYASIIINLFVLVLELTITHPTDDAHTTVNMIVKGRYKNGFWFGTVLIGNIVPLVLLYMGGLPIAMAAAACVLIGIYITEKIWVEAPQRIPLT